jgi:hypothetical protein
MRNQVKITKRCVDEPTDACNDQTSNLVDCGVDRQPAMRVWHTRIVVLPRRIASIVVGLFLIIQQLLLLLARSRQAQCLAHTPVALAARGCSQASGQGRASRLGEGDVLTGRSRSAGRVAMGICVCRGFANRGAGGFGGGSQDAGRAEGRGSEGLALRG